MASLFAQEVSSKKPFTFDSMGPPSEQVKPKASSSHLDHKPAVDQPDRRMSRPKERVTFDHRRQSNAAGTSASLPQSPAGSKGGKPRLLIKSRNASLQSRNSSTRPSSPEDFLRMLQDLVRSADIRVDGDPATADKDKDNLLGPPSTVRQGQRRHSTFVGGAAGASLAPPVPSPRRGSAQAAMLLPPTAPPRRGSVSSGQDLPSAKKKAIPMDMPADTHLPKRLQPDPMTNHPGSSSADQEDLSELHRKYHDVDAISNFDEGEKGKYATNLGRAEFGTLQKSPRTGRKEERDKGAALFQPSQSVLQKKGEVLDVIAKHKKEVKEAKGKGFQT
jgi:hypothetical protein